MITQPEAEIILNGLWAGKELLEAIRESARIGYNEIVDEKIEKAIQVVIPFAPSHMQ